MPLYARSGTIEETAIVMVPWNKTADEGTTIAVGGVFGRGGTIWLPTRFVDMRETRVGASLATMILAACQVRLLLEVCYRSNPNQRYETTPIWTLQGDVYAYDFLSQIFHSNLTGPHRDTKEWLGTVDRQLLRYDVPSVRPRQ